MLYIIFRKAVFPLGIQHYSESNHLLGEITGKRGARKEKSPRADRRLTRVLPAAWEKSPGDEGRSQDGTIHFLEKPLRENVERSDGSRFLGETL